jgi:hypothetical protein
MMRVHLDRPVFGTTGDNDADLTDDEADGRACIRCGRREGPMLAVSWVDRPAAVLARLGVSDDARTCALFAHDECPPRDR